MLAISSRRSVIDAPPERNFGLDYETAKRILDEHRAQRLKMTIVAERVRREERRKPGWPIPNTPARKKNHDPDTPQTKPARRRPEPAFGHHSLGNCVCNRGNRHMGHRHGDSPNIEADMTSDIDVQTIARMRLPESGPTGWGVRMQQRFNYHSPDEWYEAVLLSLVSPQIDWLDVGCGHELFPANRKLSQLLSARCRITGVDPDPAIHRNPWLRERHQCRLDEFATEQQFDLISMRMVAEHIADPDAAVAKLGALTRLGGRVVVYTVSKWSPVSLLAAMTPTWVHARIKRAAWNTPDDDTFPTVFKMNTRRDLDRVFGRHGFFEENFARLNDTRTLGGWRATAFAELLAERALRAIWLPYPEACILGVYRRL
jgi:SAM-dependent methyltransferase